MTTVGLALIARNEANTLPTLLQSIDGAFDRVVLVDTGSTDDTKQIFLQWAAGQSCTFSVGDFEWCDDFAAARVAADNLLMWGATTREPEPGRPSEAQPAPLVEWTCWADCDDIIEGAQNLRRLAETAPPDLSAFIGSYAYATDEHGNVICTLRRERLVRAGRGHWTGRVHEAQLIDGQSTLVDPQAVRWVHRKPADVNPGDRNLKILHAWNQESPGDARVLAYLGTETAARGLHQEALRYYGEYLNLKTGWDEERAQVHRKMAVSLFAVGLAEDALEVGVQALKTLPGWTDSYLTLAQASHNMGEHAKAIDWAQEVLRRGMPDTLLIVNPMDYTFAPLQCLAAAHGALGQADEAVQYAEQALSIIPNDQALRQYHARWAATRKRDSTARTFAACARLLIEHDEQLKALTLIEDTIPHYATDHAEIVELRSAIRERVRPLLDPAGIAEHYQAGNEAGYQDPDQAGQLPRAQFLLAGIREQREEAKMPELRYPAEKLGEDDDDGTMPENVAALAERVVGHRIVSAEQEGGVFTLTLDTGARVTLRDTSDCCAFTDLEGFLLNPAGVDHAITGVGTTEGYTKWHIYADFGDVVQMDVGWSCGNPFYYGYGFDIAVEPVDEVRQAA